MRVTSVVPSLGKIKKKKGNRSEGNKMSHNNYLDENNQHKDISSH